MKDKAKKKLEKVGKCLWAMSDPISYSAVNILKGKKETVEEKRIENLLKWEKILKTGRKIHLPVQHNADYDPIFVYMLEYYGYTDLVERIRREQLKKGK